MIAAAPPADLLKTRQHFIILDGLRGVAALAVVVFHFMEIAVPDYSKNFIAHAYLAVDFFFCLSGFVIAYAYDKRLEKMGPWQFFKLRLLRLHPLVIIGSVIGLLVFVLDPLSNLYRVYGNGRTLLMFLTSCLMIPYPVVKERYYNLFHLNPPSWSLFWEYVANIVYALVLIRLRNRMLWVLAVLAGVALCLEAYRSGSLGVGWGGDNIMGGGVRVSYSFLVGMLVYRSGRIIKSQLGFVPMALLLTAAFLIPVVNGYTAITDALVILFYFPFLVALGAGAELREGVARLCKFSGEISYPLYMTHYPFIWLYMSYMEAKKPAMGEVKLIIPVATLLLIIMAYGIMVFVDAPIRKYLRNRMEKHV